MQLFVQHSVEVRACIPISKGEEITDHYVTALNGTMYRRTHLRDGWFFECKCQRCQDPNEFRTNCSAFICNKKGLPKISNFMQLALYLKFILYCILIHLFLFYEKKVVQLVEEVFYHLIQLISMQLGSVINVAMSEDGMTTIQLELRTAYLLVWMITKKISRLENNCSPITQI